MRVAASLLAVLATSLFGVQAAHAQSADKSQQSTAATGKAHATPKAAAPQPAARPGTSAVNTRGAGDADKAKLQGVSTTPASDSKKGSGCQYGQASDA